MNVNSEDISRAVAVLKKGGIILYPTDTVWGIGCDATDAAAVQRIYELKKRQDNKAMIVLVSDLAMLERTVSGIPDVAYDLIDVSDRPLTIIYDRTQSVAPNLTGTDGSLGVRVAGNAFVRALCRGLGRPVVSTSANISGRPAPGCFDDIEAGVVNGVDYVCASGRDLKGGKPSMVMKLSADGTFKILRS